MKSYNEISEDNSKSADEKVNIARVTKDKANEQRDDKNQKTDNGTFEVTELCHSEKITCCQNFIPRILNDSDFKNVF